MIAAVFANYLLFICAKLTKGAEEDEIRRKIAPGAHERAHDPGRIGQHPWAGHAQSDMEQMVASVSALYSGGRLSEEDKDALARALMDAYWIAKGKQSK